MSSCRDHRVSKWQHHNLHCRNQLKNVDSRGIWTRTFGIPVRRSTSWDIESMGIGGEFWLRRYRLIAKLSFHNSLRMILSRFIGRLLIGHITVNSGWFWNACTSSWRPFPAKVLRSFNMSINCLKHFLSALSSDDGKTLLFTQAFAVAQLIVVNVSIIEILARSTLTFHMQWAWRHALFTGKVVFRIRLS